MPIDFPSSPITGQSYTYNSKQWTWNGINWAISNVGNVGPTGATGATGAAGGTNDGGACMAFGVTGVWFRPPYGIGTQSLSTNGTQHLPIWIERTTTFDRIAVSTVTVTTAGTMYLGIYNDSTTNPGRPGTLKLNAGAVGFTANNRTYAITINETLNRGWYWLSSYLTGGSSTWRGHGAYVENFWYPRIFGTPDQGSPYDAICPTLFGGTTFGDNPSVSYNGYATNTIFLRTKV